jgi:hypothetical protein
MVGNADREMRILLAIAAGLKYPIFNHFETSGKNWRERF